MIRWRKEDGYYGGRLGPYQVLVRENGDGVKWWLYQFGHKRTDLGAREIDGYPADSIADAMMDASNAVANCMGIKI